MDCTLAASTRDPLGHGDNWQANCRPDRIDAFAQELRRNQNIVWGTVISHEIGYHILANTVGGGISNQSHLHQTGFIDSAQPAYDGREVFSPRTCQAICKRFGID
jgi:hypothetical protein